MLLHLRNGGSDMQTKERIRFANDRSRERNEEVIGVLMAISIVSKRLAGRMATLECRDSKGGKFSDKATG